MTSAQRHWKTGRGVRAGLALLTAAVALLAVGAVGANAAPTGSQRATKTCWKDVVNDWLQHEPNVLGRYPLVCYTQAIQHLNAYVDIKQYSNAPDDIHRALLAAIHEDQSGGGGNGNSSGGAPGGPGGGPSGPSGGQGSPGGSGTSSTTPSRSLVTRLFDAVGPGDAQSIPLPLLVLAGLALLLLLTAAGTWLAKRIQARQARQMTPAPAPARRQ